MPSAWLTVRDRRAARSVARAVPGGHLEERGAADRLVLGRLAKNRVEQLLGLRDHPVQVLGREEGLVKQARQIGLDGKEGRRGD